jgi:hypothetical protein
LVIIVQFLLSVLQHKRNMKDTGKRCIGFRGAIEGQHRIEGGPDVTSRNIVIPKITRTAGAAIFLQVL